MRRHDDTPFDPDVLQGAIQRIAEQRRHLRANRALLVAVDGIDAARAQAFAEALRLGLAGAGLRTADFDTTGYRAVGRRRFAGPDAALTWYRDGFRFEELLQDVVLPLRGQRSLRAMVRHVEPTAAEAEPRFVEFGDLDVLVLCGPFLLRRDLRPFFDATVWVGEAADGDTGEHPAIRRASAGLGTELARRVWHLVFGPALAHYLRLDRPQSTADVRVGVGLRPEAVPDGQRAAG